MKNEEFKEKHNEEIIASRVGGFGGSDANLFLKIARKGVDGLAPSEVLRIKVALGVEPPRGGFAGNVYTEAGHLFEQYVADNIELLNADGDVQREAVIENDGFAFPRNFKLFAHADFYNAGAGTVYELKFSQTDTARVANTYSAQFQWYYILNKDIAAVELVHGTGSVLPFTVGGICRQQIYCDNDIICELARGIRMLDEAIDEGYFVDNARVVTIDKVDEERQKAALLLTQRLTEIKECERQVADLREQLTTWMRDNGVRSINGKTFSVTYTPPTTRRAFDSKKALEKYPELSDERFYTTSEVRDGVKIMLKNRE